MPVSVEISINFARTEEILEAEEGAGINLEEDPDFKIMVPVMVGM